MPAGRLSRLLPRRSSSSSEVPEHLQYVFVVTYGRSGSTLAQGLLNTLPGALIRGENNLYLLPLFRSAQLARSFKRKHRGHGAENVHSAFYGLHELDLSLFAESTRSLVVRQLLGTVDPAEVRYLGFKEVLWHRVNGSETETFFAFMDEAFPGAKYVLNQRDHEQVASSGFWQKQERDEVMKAILRVEEIQAHLRSTRADRVFDTRYEQLTSSDQSVVDEQLRGLATFVTGSCDDGLLAALRQTMTKGHGPNPFGASKKKQKKS